MLVMLPTLGPKLVRLLVGTTKNVTFMKTKLMKVDVSVRIAFYSSSKWDLQYFFNFFFEIYSISANHIFKNLVARNLAVNKYKIFQG